MWTYFDGAYRRKALSENIINTINELKNFSIDDIRIVFDFDGVLQTIMFMLIRLETNT